MYTNVYHVHPPTGVEAVGELKKIDLKSADQTHRHHHIRTANLDSEGDAISSRIPLFFNSDVVISKARGKWIQKEIGTVKPWIIASFHPAFLMRQPEQKKLAWIDLKMIRDKSKILKI